MCCIANCKFWETVEHSVSTVLDASVSGVVFPMTTHVYCAHVFEQRVLPTLPRSGSATDDLKSRIELAGGT